MFGDRLPITIEPYKLARDAGFIEGDIPLDKCERVISALADTQGHCHVRLEFDIDPQRIRFIRGKLKGQLMVSCQRCMQPMPIDVDSEFLLAIASSDEAAANLPKQYEPLIVEDEKLELLPVIEDEILLTLPITSYHDEGECSVSSEMLVSGDVEEAQPETKPENPFSVLMQLKDKR
ncbi:YceD family protein [Oceanospirillum sediminis]|uniref:Large ribosomal RNA subunit accumulation protein YceD n=1 Tax=Oceanospirillum sediminis TaxID=2760088 RepID=A0A839ISS5_9GAMM|nr:YceD family protein [Oceanospirillum sediminis]MBB1487477.1 DUF177 domain-containing protein [Oceanospirillum sediminis]